MADLSITAWERKYLRELAHKQVELASLPVMKEREALWLRHNDLSSEVPVVSFETNTCEQDLLPPIKCTSNTARGIELQFHRTMLNQEMIGDDRVVPPYFGIGWSSWMVLFDLRVDRTHAEDGRGGYLGHKFIHPITDLREDIHHLKPTVKGSDKEGTLQWKAYLEDIFGDIIPIRVTMGSLGASLSQHVVHLMGMENMMYAMVDCPDEFKQFMDKIADAYIEYFKWIEAQGLICPNSANDWLGQGTLGFTRDLPQWSADASQELHGIPKPVTTSEVWGYMDSQETVSISPAMFGEFFYPAYRKVAEVFGLLSYGCCEPVHSFWEGYISKLPHLRKVSISPWCDERYMGEVLAGSNVIYHRKPSPNFIGVGSQLDEEAFKEHILTTLNAAKGCTLEFSFRDIYSLNGDNQKPRRGVQIIRELIDKHWNR